MSDDGQLEFDFGLPKDKVPDNIILFPKIPMKRNNQRAQLDARRQEMMRQQHNQAYVQAIVEELTESMLLRLREENINITTKEFLSDYKLSLEALKSMVLRVVHMKHPLQQRVDRAVQTKGEGKDIYAITIDYKKF
tara:strand:+ start:6890 stop:7297 length:408 start_codon:yes stop_codon:yes gene_type:complete